MLIIEGDKKEVTTISHSSIKPFFFSVLEPVFTEAHVVNNVVKTFCHLVAALSANRGERHMSSGLFLSDNELGCVCAEEEVKQKQC